MGKSRSTNDYSTSNNKECNFSSKNYVDRKRNGIISIVLHQRRKKGPLTRSSFVSVRNQLTVWGRGVTILAFYLAEIKQGEFNVPNGGGIRTPLPTER